VTFAVRPCVLWPASWGTPPCMLFFFAGQRALLSNVKFDINKCLHNDNNNLRNCHWHPKQQTLDAMEYPYSGVARSSSYDPVECSNRGAQCPWSPLDWGAYHLDLYTYRALHPSEVSTWHTGNVWQHWLIDGSVRFLARIKMGKILEQNVRFQSYVF